jgi:hypothetical protein
VLLDSEAIWESFITSDYVRKIVTPFLAVKFDWGLLSPLKSLRLFVVFVDCLTVGPDGDMWGVLLVENHLIQM